MQCTWQGGWHSVNTPNLKFLLLLRISCKGVQGLDQRLRLADAQHHWLSCQQPGCLSAIWGRLWDPCGPKRKEPGWKKSAHWLPWAVIGMRVPLLKHWNFEFICYGSCSTLNNLPPSSTDHIPLLHVQMFSTTPSLWTTEVSQWALSQVSPCHQSAEQDKWSRFPNLHYLSFLVLMLSITCLRLSLRNGILNILRAFSKLRGNYLRKGSGDEWGEPRDALHYLHPRWW